MTTTFDFRNLTEKEISVLLDTVLEVIKNPDTPASTLEAILEKATAKNIIESIKSKIEEAVHIAMQRKNSTDIPTFDFSDDKNKILEAAKNPNTPSEILDFLMKNNDIKVRTAIASNPSTLSSTLHKLVKCSQSQNVLLEVAKNANTDTKTLEIIAKKDWHYILPFVASLIEHKNVTSDVIDVMAYRCLDQLIYSSSYDALTLIARHHKTSPDILMLIAKHLNTSDFISEPLVKKNIDNDITQPSLNPSNSSNNFVFDVHQKTKSNLAIVSSNQEVLTSQFVAHTEELEDFDDDDDDGLLSIQHTDYSPSSSSYFEYDKHCITRYLYVYDIGIEEIMEFMKYKQRIKNGEWTSYYHVVEAEKSLFKVKKSVNEQPTGFKIPPPPEALQFNTARISEIKMESKKVSAMLNAIYEQDEITSVMINTEKSAPQTTQPVLNLDTAHLEIVKILATRLEWERNELQKMMKGMMIDGVLEHINEAFFDYCDEAFIEGDDPIEINVELYKEIFK